MRLGGQMRFVNTVVIGWDMTAALALARALSIPAAAAAELLPEIEQVMAAKINENRPGGSTTHE